MSIKLDILQCLDSVGLYADLANLIYSYMQYYSYETVIEIKSKYKQYHDTSITILTDVIFIHNPNHTNIFERIALYKIDNMLEIKPKKDSFVFASFVFEHNNTIYVYDDYSLHKIELDLSNNTYEIVSLGRVKRLNRHILNPLKITYKKDHLFFVLNEFGDRITYALIYDKLINNVCEDVDVNDIVDKKYIITCPYLYVKQEDPYIVNNPDKVYFSEYLSLFMDYCYIYQKDNKLYRYFHPMCLVCKTKCLMPVLHSNPSSWHVFKLIDNVMYFTPTQESSIKIDTVLRYTKIREDLHYIQTNDAIKIIRLI